MLALRRTWLTLVIQCKSQCSRNVYISGVYAEDDKDPLHLPGVLRTITCQDRWNSYWYQLQLRRTSSVLLMFSHIHHHQLTGHCYHHRFVLVRFSDSAVSITQLSHPSLQRYQPPLHPLRRLHGKVSAITFFFSSFVITHAFTAASPKSSVTAVVERLHGNAACPWRAPKYISITYITFVLSLVSWKIQRSYLLHSMYLLRDCLSPHLHLHREEDKSTWGFEISNRNSTYITPSNACGWEDLFQASIMSDMKQEGPFYTLS